MTTEAFILAIQFMLRAVPVVGRRELPACSYKVGPVPAESDRWVVPDR